MRRWWRKSKIFGGESKNWINTWSIRPSWPIQSREPGRTEPYGPIKITGIPDPQYRRKGAARERLRKMLAAKEEELLELTCQAEKYIENIDKSEVRIMFRLYYIDGLPWWKVAQAMNRMLPRRRVKFTEDSCRMRNNRFFEEI